MNYLSMGEYIDTITLDYPNDHKFLVYTGIRGRHLSAVTVDKSTLKFDFSRDEIKDVVSDILRINSIMDEKVMYVDDSYTEHEAINNIMELRAANRIAASTRRGRGNTIIDKKFVTYIGNGGEVLCDTGMVLYRNSNDKFAVVTIDMTGATSSKLSNYILKFAE